MLTDITARALKPEKAAYKKSDSKGLFLTVHPTGKKTWGLAFRIEGKQKFLSGGAFPEVSLRQARDWRDAIKAQLTLGMAPTATPQCLQPEPETADTLKPTETFEQVAREWFSARRVNWVPKYAALVIGRLESDIFPVLGSQAINTITPRQMLGAIRSIQDRGAVEMAHRVKNHCSEIFRYAIPDGRCESDPCRDLAPGMAKPAPTKHRSKVPAKDLPAFYIKLNADGGDRLSHVALRWTMITMVRTQETRFAEWSEFEGLDTANPLWRIPAHRMKMGLEHLVPLAPQAIRLLKEISALNVYRTAGVESLGRYLFPMAGARSSVISENRMLDIMYRIGLRGKATVHGFRGLASTVLNESGRFKADWIERQLAHVPGGVRAAYNSAEYLTHRRRMMNWWADYLDAAEKAGRLEEPAEFGMILT